jgi:cytochrome oxidase Cu insertion factor (SCO1/SenC/PrrC family)
MRTTGPRLLCTALAILAGVLIIAGVLPAAWAHDPRASAAGGERPELSFGRSEQYDYDPPVPGSYRLPAIKSAPDGQVLDSEGRPRRLHVLMDGRITILAFIYTRCSDPRGCPLAMSLLYDLQYVARQDPAIGDSLRLMALSFDVEHDTPEVMADYASTHKDHGEAGELLFLTASSQAELAPILEGYDQPIGRKLDAADPFGPYTHQLRVFLIDPERRIRNIYSLGFLDPRLVATDIRTLLLERRGQSPGG